MSMLSEKIWRMLVGNGNTGGGRWEQFKDEGCIPIVMIMVGGGCDRHQVDNGNDTTARRQTTCRLVVTHGRSLGCGMTSHEIGSCKN